MNSLTDEEIEAMANKRHKSVLWPYKDEICRMKDAGVTLLEITNWLSLQKVTTSAENVRQFCLRNSSIKQKAITKKNKQNKLDSSHAFDNLIPKMEK